MRNWASTGLVLVAATLATSSVRAQPTARTVYFYNASVGTAPADDLGAQPAPWGNGVIRPTRQLVDYEGAPVLEVTTRNFAEGARFDLVPPLNIEPYMGQGFLRFRFKFAEDVQETRGGGGNMDGGADKAGGFGFRQMLPPAKGAWKANAQFGAPAALPPLGRGKGKGRGNAVPGGDAGFPGADGGAMVGPPLQFTDITEMRVTLIRESGVMVGRIPINLDAMQPDRGGWRLFVLPLNAMTQTKNASGPVQRLLLTSDKEDTFFLAQAAVVVDTPKMAVSIRPPEQAEGAQISELTVKPGAITLVADVEAGAADPLIEWNFDADNVGNLPPANLDNLGGAGETDAFGNPGAPARPGAGRPQAGAPKAGRPAVPGVMGGDAGQPEVVGPRIDARGLTATFDYPNEEQNYRVEVKVTDKSGKKEPVTASVLIKVRG